MACPNTGIQIIRSILLKVAYQIRRKYPEVLKRISKSWISNFIRLRQIPPPFRDVTKTRFNYTRGPARCNLLNKNPKTFPLRTRIEDYYRISYYRNSHGHLPFYHLPFYRVALNISYTASFNFYLISFHVIKVNIFHRNHTPLLLRTEIHAP